MEKFKKFLNDTKKKTFLDIGTGAGNFVQFIAEMYEDYDSILGIDTYEKGIEAANKRNENDRIKFEVMDAYNNKYKDNSFDVVCLSNSLHHFNDVQGIIKEMARLVKKDGYIIFNEMMSDNLDAMQISHKKLHHLSAKIDRLNGDVHNETYTKDEILNKIQENTGLFIYDSWEVDVPRRKENSEEELKYIFNILDRVMTRVPETHQEEISKDAEGIKTYIQENGYDGCTSLLAVATK